MSSAWLNGFHSDSERLEIAMLVMGHSLLRCTFAHALARLTHCFARALSHSLPELRGLCLQIECVSFQPTVEWPDRFDLWATSKCQHVLSLRANLPFTPKWRKIKHTTTRRTKITPKGKIQQRKKGIDLSVDNGKSTLPFFLLLVETMLYRSYSFWRGFPVRIPAWFVQ